MPVCRMALTSKRVKSTNSSRQMSKRELDTV